MTITDSNRVYASNTPVTVNNTYAGSTHKSFSMIDNYIYLYHTDTLIAIPTYPDSISDSMAVNFQSSSMLSRSAPIFSYSGSGPRNVSISLHLHRDMMNDVNISASRLNVPDLNSEDYVDIMIRQIQAAALPRYASSEKMVNPPIVAVRFGEDIFCKGVIQGTVGVTYSGPILRTNKYAEVTVEFVVYEIDPYDADTVMLTGSYRGINTDLERRVWKNSASASTSAIL